MLAMWVKVKIKAAMRDKFLKAIEADALGSERDEPGCLRFNVLQDEKDENVYYFYEVYKDQAALEAHRNTPHYAIWRGVADVLEGPTEPTRCRNSADERWSFLLYSRLCGGSCGRRCSRNRPRSPSNNTPEIRLCSPSIRFACGGDRTASRRPEDRR